MSWNGSNSAGASVPAPKKPAKKSPGLAHGLIAGGAIVLVGIVALYFVNGEKDVAEAEHEKSVKIAEVKADIPTPKTNVSVRVEDPDVLDGHRKGEFWYDSNGKRMITMVYKGKLQHVEVYAKENSSIPKTRIFEHRSENAIASLLYAVPGAPVYGNVSYAGMNADFIESCKTPIIVGAEDSDFVKQLKRDVIQAKIELKKRVDAGENLDKILSDTRQELQKLAQVRSEIEKMARDMIREDAKTTEDVELVKEAVNKMFEDKGVSPVRFNAILDFQIKRMKEGEVE